MLHTKAAERVFMWMHQYVEGRTKGGGTTIDLHGEKRACKPQNNQTQMFHHQGSDQSMTICTSLVPTGRAGLLNSINRSGR